MLEHLAGQELNFSLRSRWRPKTERTEDRMLDSHSSGHRKHDSDDPDPGDTGQRFLGHVYEYCDNLPEDLSEMTAVLNRLYSLACFLNLKRKNNEEKKWAFCCKKTDNTPFFLHCKWRFLFSIGRFWTFAGLKAFYQRKWSLSLCCAVSLSEKENQKMPFVHMKTEQIGT